MALRPYDPQYSFVQPPPRVDDDWGRAPPAPSEVDTFGDTARLAARDVAEGWAERTRGREMPGALPGLVVDSALSMGELYAAAGLGLLSEFWPHSLTHPHLGPDQAEREFVDTFLREIPESLAGTVPLPLGAVGQAEHRLRRSAGDFTEQYPGDELGTFHNAFAVDPDYIDDLFESGVRPGTAEERLGARFLLLETLLDEGVPMSQAHRAANILPLPINNISGDDGQFAYFLTQDRLPTLVGPEVLAELSARPGERAALDTILDRPSYLDELFGPDIRAADSTVAFTDDLPRRVAGTYSPTTRDLQISRRQSPAEVVRTIFHEGEHDLQARPGSALPEAARGTNTGRLAELAAQERANLQDEMRLWRRALRDGDTSPDEYERAVSRLTRRLDDLPRTEAERFALYQNNLGELLARRAEGDMGTSVPVGWGEALNPYIPTQTYFGRGRGGIRDILPSFAATVPANLYNNRQLLDDLP